MFLVSKLVFAFGELHMRFSVNELLICILYCDARSSCLIRTVCKSSILILYFEKAIRLSRKVLMFLAAI